MPLLHLCAKCGSEWVWGVFCLFVCISFSVSILFLSLALSTFPAVYAMLKDISMNGFMVQLFDIDVFCSGWFLYVCISDNDFSHFKKMNNRGHMKSLRICLQNQVGIGVMFYHELYSPHVILVCALTLEYCSFCTPYCLRSKCSIINLDEFCFRSRVCYMAFLKTGECEYCFLTTEFFTYIPNG